MRRKLTVLLALIVIVSAAAAPSCDNLDKAAARAARASVYAQTAKDALPVFAAELKLVPEKAAKIDALLGKARDAAKELSIILDQIKSKALDEATGKVKARELLGVVAAGIDNLALEGFFEFPNASENVKKAVGVAILGLRTAVGLLQSDLR